MGRSTPGDDAGVEQRRLELVRADIEALAATQGRLPTPAQVHELLHRRGLDSHELSRLLSSSAPVEAGRRRPPTPTARERDIRRPVPRAPSTTAITAAAVPVRPADPAVEAPWEYARDRDIAPVAARSPHPWSLDAGTEGDGEDWNDADPFAAPRPRTPVPPSVPALPGDGATVGSADPLVERTAADLRDDHERAGTLSLGDVTDLARRRSLDARQLEEVLVALAARGVQVTDDDLDPHHARDLDGRSRGNTTGGADRDALGAYFAAAARYRLLNAEDEVRLGRAVQAGLAAETAASDDPTRSRREQQNGPLRAVVEAGRQARHDLVCANLRLVVTVARWPRYRGASLELAELVQEGNTGLMHAVTRYDPELGYKFSTYAVWWIRQAIERAEANLGRTIRLPVHVVEAVNLVRRTSSRLEDELGRSPDVTEVATATGMDPGKVAAVRRWSAPVLAYDTLVGEDGEATLLDLLAADLPPDVFTDPAHVVELAALTADVRAVLHDALDPRSAFVLVRRFGLDDREAATLEQISTDLHLTRERVRQLQNKALEQLRGDARASALYDYLVTSARTDIVVPPVKDPADEVAGSQEPAATVGR